MLAAPVLPARAATVLKGFSVSEGITVDGVGKTIAAQVTYDWSATPTIASANNTTVTGGTGSTFQVTVTSTAPISYSLSGEPTGVSVDDTGLITITNATINGTHIFTITASNGTAPDVTQTFTLYVLDPAHAYAVGDAYPYLGAPIGVVINIINSGVNGTIISLDQGQSAWNDASVWYTQKGAGWYWPTRSDWSKINGIVNDTNVALTTAGGTALNRGTTSARYWTSESDGDPNSPWGVQFGDDGTSYTTLRVTNTNHCYLRAFLDF